MKTVGRLLDYLEENGMLENTVIFYTSDQGFYMGEHGLVRQAVHVRGVVQPRPRDAPAETF